MKLISHLLILVVGAGLGVWWGVNHPEAAQNVATNEEQQAAKIQEAVSKEKIVLLKKFLDTTQPDQSSSEFKQMLNQEKQNLQNAKAKLLN
ncbi:MAG TPA: hypothetical protein VHX86_00510 [Tepidisphaeraceae bacterium]|jgi:hypothetical protein|nr:hypothetical protein [Tepidisphaeraceae bacterium]